MRGGGGGGDNLQFRLTNALNYHFSSHHLFAFSYECKGSLRKGEGSSGLYGACIIIVRGHSTLLRIICECWGRYSSETIN